MKHDKDQILNNIVPNMGQLDWDDLRIFLHVVRAGNIRDAATQLGSSKSTVARRIEALEDKFSFRLFSKKSGRYHLTQSGEDIYNLALHIEEQVSLFSQKAFGKDEVLRGPVKLTLIDALAVSPLLDIFTAFTNKYPDVQLEIDVRNGYANLDRGEADLALRFSASPPDHLIGRRLMKTGRAVYVSNRLLETNPDLININWISYSPAGQTEKWKKSTPFPNRPSRIHIIDMPTQLAACRQGIGLAHLPCFLASSSPDLVRISEPDFPSFQELWLLRHANAKQNARVRTLYDFLSSSIKDLDDKFLGKTGPSQLGF